MARSAWLTRLNLLVDAAVRPGRYRRHRGFRPWLEALERRLPPTVTFSVSDPAPFPKPDSGQIQGLFVVTRSGDLAPAVQVDYATQDGTGPNGAHAAIDYVATSGALRFASNQTMATVSVPILGNNIFQADKTFTLSLTDPLPSADFAPQQTFAAGPFPFKVAVGDFNGDGKPDLVVLDGGGATTGEVLLNATPAGATTPSFYPPWTFTAFNPQGIAVGDFNGDGRPDLVVIRAIGPIQVLLNTTPPGATRPSFSTSYSSTVSEPLAVAVGDFNGDGKPDLAVTDANTNTVSVLLNQTTPGSTTPSFGAPQTFGCGPAPFGLAVGDFNGDGKPDLAVANGTYASVLLNTTTPGATTVDFTPRQTFGGGNDTFNVIAGDLNGDGKPDLAAVGQSSAAVLANTTPPGATIASFAPQQTFPLNQTPDFVTEGDFNGDGKLDLALANNDFTGSVSVLLNITPPGATLAAFAPEQTFATGTLPRSVVVADFNGDGKPDLAVGTRYNVAVLLNQRVPITVLPSFTPQQTFATNHGPRSVAVADLNGDGRPDLAILDRGSGTVSVLLNTTPAGSTTPSFAPDQTFLTGGSGRANSATTGDLNGDGRPDVVVGFAYSSAVSVLLNTTPAGSMTASFAPPTTFATGSDPRSVAIADFNGDGKPDLAVADASLDSVSVLLNTTSPGSTIPSFTPQQTFAVGASPLSVAVGDFNGDGKPDLVVANFGSNTLSVLLNTTPAGGTTPTFAPQQTFPSGIGTHPVAVADFNGDGKPDLVVVNSVSYGTVSVLLNTTPAGAATPTFAPLQTFATRVDPLSVAVGDFNGDGKPDLAVGNSASVSVLLNTTPPGATTPAFAAHQDFATMSEVSSVAVGDFNGDGKPDLVAVNASYPTDSVSVLLNNVVPLTLTNSQATGTIQEDDAPAAIAVVDGTSPQTAVLNTAFAVPLAVDVFNAIGDGVQGVSVTFTAPPNGPSGTFDGSTSVTVVTDASGRATAPTFTANTVAGSYTVTAQAAGGSDPATTFSLTNSPGTPAMVVALSGSVQNATVATDFAGPLVAQVTDQFGTPLFGISVTFAAPQFGPSATFIGGPTALTDINGMTSKSFTANEVAGTYNITATAAGGTNPIAVFFNLTNMPDVPALLLAIVGGGQSTPVGTDFPTSLVARVSDQYGNRVPGVLVTFTAPDQGPSATFPDGPTAISNGNGLAIEAITANTVAGTYSITASAGAGVNLMASFDDLTNTPAAADHFVVTTSAPRRRAGRPFDVTVTAADPYGNTDTSYTGTVHFSSADPYGATLPPDYTFQAGDAGVATFPGGATLYTAGTWDVTATDTASGITGAASVVVTPARAVTLEVLAPSEVASGVPFDVTVVAVDPYGNTDPRYRGTVAFTTSDPDAGVVLPPDYTFQRQDAGTATFPGGVALVTPGDQTLTVTDTASGITGSATLTVTPGTGLGLPPGAGPPEAAATRTTPNREPAVPLFISPEGGQPAVVWVTPIEAVPLAHRRPAIDPADAALGDDWDWSGLL